ncbi:GNAT family N-acetyltransferase [Pseudonocardia kunmingensis]|uniref:Acetyltransferase (GNAT) family protein n=1 Tax=Pseudonocardia kunmingensis TaxID=630975 RepID=A0A543DX49_9PSEU|nr:GNAT family N-acetyltransferase [Pseudonocardia kunmingensis]TQM13891.1 acetyltransferase (GNAT) family protein [Pseudonocardia kunmingensis]
MIDERLAAHLRTWLGRWPGDGPGPTVVGWPARDEPGWDGGLHRVLGVTTPEHGVLSVPPPVADVVRAWLAAGRDPAGIPAATGIAGRWFDGVFRWCTAPAPLPDAGEWRPAGEPSVPEWLRPFGGEVLVAVDPASGEHLAGVGVKRHDAHGRELAVVTAPAARGRGLARRLVAQAARRVLDEGAVPTYVHARRNTASAAVATAAGFPDVGWSLLGVEPE